MPSNLVRANVNVREQFARVTEEVDRAAIAGLNAGAQLAAREAQAGASIDLELEVVPAHGDVDGFTSGIRARAKSGGEYIAWFFDRGTLGGRRRKLKRPRKETWSVDRGDASYTAHRREEALAPGGGIPAERFFGKAKAAGRRRLLEQLAQLRRV